MTRVGAVGYLNARALVFGLEQGLGADGIELSYDVPSRLAERMRAGELDVALLPTIELGGLPAFELVPGLGIVSRGAARSVLLVSRVPLERIERVALDPESRTSNALSQVLFADAWGRAPEFHLGPLDLAAALAGADAAVRIGDKALFEPVPDGCEAHDLGTAWTALTGLPFVFAAWVARPGVVDRPLYKLLHESHRSGTRVVDLIAEDYTWNGRRDPAVSRAYLRENIRHRLGADELRGLRRFLDAAARLGLIERAPELRMALVARAACAPQT